MQLYDAVIAAFETEDKIILDFAVTDYVSSAGLRVLLQGHKAAESTGKKMLIVYVKPEVMDIFSMTGFDGVLHIE